MAKPAKPAAAAAGAAKPNNNKMIVIIVAVLALVIAGGAGWYFTQGGKHDGKEAAEEAPVPTAEPKFVALDPFTVNLQQEEGEQFLQIGITLKVAELGLEEKIKARLPEIRSRLLLLLSNKRASDLIPADGKVKLAQEVIAETESVLGLAPAQPAMAAMAASTPPAALRTSGRVDVLFTSFIIQ